MLRTTTAIVVLAAAGAAASAGDQSVLLTLDVSDPAAVVLTATGNAALLEDSSASANAGITLLSVFAEEFELGFGAPDLVGDLMAGGAGPQVNPLNSFAMLTDFDVNLFGGSGTQMFNTTDAAFTGSAIANFDGAVFPAAGTIGDIIVGDTSTSSSGATIGQWQIVPAPGAAALLAMGGLVGTRRRRA